VDGRVIASRAIQFGRVVPRKRLEVGGHDKTDEEYVLAYSDTPSV
jgi:hypothetical protein